MRVKRYCLHRLKRGLFLSAVLLLLGSLQNASAQVTWNASPSPSPNSNIYYNAGNVGIGTSTPANLLDMQGSSSTVLFAYIKNSHSSGTGGVQVENDNSKRGEFGVRGSARSSYGALGANDTYFYGSSALTLMVDSGSGIMKFATGGNTERMRIDASGNVGIGTTSPSAPLHLQGTVNGVFKLLFENLSTGGSAFSSMQWKNDAGNVGVIFMNGSANTSYGGANSLGLNNSSNNPLWFGTNDTIRMFITNGGNVGIGTITPTAGYKLDVSGNIKVSGTGTGNIDAAGTITASNIVAKYQDVAEWVPASQPVPAGTVVILDTAKSNQVTSSNKAYDTRVAGVVSEQPGIALGEQSESKVLVATTGRVMVKVDASRGAIHIGDLLVTSDVPGLAMKSEPVNLGGVQLHRPGTLIGKALEPLEKGSGKILVLLSLQ